MQKLADKTKIIYIQLWLDLLCEQLSQQNWESGDLHSTMVRFIIFAENVFLLSVNAFTFHYG